MIIPHAQGPFTSNMRRVKKKRKLDLFNVIANKKKLTKTKLHELNLKITQRLSELEFSLKWKQPPRGVFKKGILKNLTNP